MHQSSGCPHAYFVNENPSDRQTVQYNNTVCIVPVNAPPFLQVLPRLLSQATTIESAVLESRFHLAGPMDYPSRKLVDFIVRLGYGLTEFFNSNEQGKQQLRSRTLPSCNK
jgi:hypothetical protein